MKTLQKYLLRQVAATLLLTVAVFTAVLLIGNALREILTLLTTTHVSPLFMVRALLYLIPFVWVFALPMGMLTATLLVFGRFSADQELTAARASGVSLLSLVTPVLALSLLCCAVSAYFNMELGPRCRVAYLRLIEELKTELVSANVLPEGRFVRDIPGYVFYIGKNRDGKLENVNIWLQNETNSSTMVRAVSGELRPDKASHELLLDLFDARSVTVGARGNSINAFPTLQLRFNPNTGGKKEFKPGINDMTFVQLRQELRDLENLPVAAAAGSSDALKEQLAAMRKEQKDFVEPVRVVMNRQIAFSFACFGFTLVGIPLGIRVHRRETNIGIAIALVLVLVYYAFLMLGASLSGRPQFYPHLILWLPNFIFQAAGVVLLWRANRGI